MSDWSRSSHCDWSKAADQSFVTRMARLHTERWVRSFAMLIDDIKRTELTPSQREVLQQDAARWERMSSGAHLDDWLSLLPGLQIRRGLAMRMAHSNVPIGKLYAEAFADLMRADGLHTIDPSNVTALLWLGEEPERMHLLQTMRGAMTPSLRARLNLPISARKRIEIILKASAQRDAESAEEVERISPAAKLRAEVAEQDRKIAQLERAADGSLLDLRVDRADDIATTIVNTVNEHKAKQIAQGILAWFKRQRRPAG
jgi:hypothetical protein